MTTHHARARRNRGPWLQALLANQTETSGAALDDLVDFIESAQEAKHALIAVDNPAPARGYALVLPVFQTLEDEELPGKVLARIHVIPSQPAEVYRALFSQIIVQARRMRSELGLSTDVQIVVDSSTVAPHVVEAVELYGAPYAVRMSDSGGERLGQDSKASSKGEPALAEIVEATGSELEDDQDALIGGDTTAEDAAEEVVEDSEAGEEESDNLYKCFDCGRTFKTPQALGSHSRSHQVD